MALIDLNIGDAYETSALPGIGDANALGGGITTSSLTNESDLRAYGLDVQSKAARGGRSGGSGYGGGPVTVDSKNNVYDAATGQKKGKAVTPQLSQNPMANHPLWTIGIIVLVLLLWKFIPKEEHEEDKQVKISLFNTLRITLMAGVGILILKWFFSVYSIASISPTIEFL